MTVTRARFAPSGRRPGGDPFDLDDEASYRAWRDAKLARYPRRAEDLVVEIRDPALPSAAEREAIAERCGRANAALYVFTQAPRDERSLRRDLIAFGAAFGLTAIEDHRSAEAGTASSASRSFATAAGSATFLTPIGRSVGTPTAIITTTAPSVACAQCCCIAPATRMRAGKIALLDP